MSNQLEYATVFDTDTQQDVVLMRRNPNQKHQKYVYDEKLERFDRLPESVTVHQESKTNTSSTLATAFEPSEDKLDGSDVEDESYYDSEFSDEDEEESESDGDSCSDQEHSGDVHASEKPSEHGVVKMFVQEEVASSLPKMEVLRGDEVVSEKMDPIDDEESDSEIEDESDGSEETGDDMEDEEVSDEEDPFVYISEKKQEEPLASNFDPDESLPAVREFRFKAPANFLHPVNLNDTANMSDIPLTSPDESLAEAETSGDDSQYCMLTNDDVLLTKRVKDPNQGCSIS